MPRCAAVFLRVELRPPHLEGSIGVFCHDTAVCVSLAEGKCSYAE